MSSPDVSEVKLRDYLMQVGHALNLVCELPEWLEQASLAKHLRHAVAESFAMYCRLLVEFLWSTSTYRSDVRASDYCDDGWLNSEIPEHLRSFGDKHVAHMTDARFDYPLVSTTYVERRDIRIELIDTARAFAAAIRDVETRAVMEACVTHAESLATWPPPPTADEDPGPFIAAIRSL